MNSRNDLPAYFAGFKQTGVGAEIGTQYGHFTLKLVEWGGTVLCVDTWLDSAIYVKAITNLWDTAATLWRIPSLSAARLLRDESLDWVYIDAAHNYTNISRDLKTWYPKVRRGGVFSGHDYVDGYFFNEQFNVKQAVDEFTFERNLDERLKVINGDCVEGLPFPSWYLEKP